MLWIHTWIFETAQIIAFSGKNAVTASFSKDGVFCCDEAHAGRKQKETASLSVQTASLGVQTASFPVHGFCTTHKTAFFFDYGVFSLKNASGKNLCRLKIQVSSLQIVDFDDFLDMCQYVYDICIKSARHVPGGNWQIWLVQTTVSLVLSRSRMSS